jgi:hypothetical protein
LKNGCGKDNIVAFALRFGSVGLGSALPSGSARKVQKQQKTAVGSTKCRNWSAIRLQKKSFQTFQTFQSTLTRFHRMCQDPSMRQVSCDSGAMPSTAANGKAVTSHRTPKEEVLPVGMGTLYKKYGFYQTNPTEKRVSILL